jgi:hypothetical protein
MTKTARVLIIGGAVAVTAVAVYRLIPELRRLAESLRQLQLLVDAEEFQDEPEDYQIKDPEALRRIDEAMEKYPDGWIARGRPQRHEPSDDEPLVTGPEAE